MCNFVTVLKPGTEVYARINTGKMGCATVLKTKILQVKVMSDGATYSVVGYEYYILAERLFETAEEAFAAE